MRSRLIAPYVLIGVIAAIQLGWPTSLMFFVLGVGTFAPAVRAERP
jgi:hypothetical protein